MKRLLILVALAAFGVCATVARATDANQMKYVQILPAQQATNQIIDTTGIGVDVAAYKGNSTFLVQCGKPAGALAAYTATMTIAHSTALGSGYVTATNLAGTAGVITFTGTNGSVQTFSCDIDRLNAYVRATATHTNDYGPMGVILVAPMKSE